LKVAIVHYWLVNWRGGEKVLEALLAIYPNADIFTHVYDESLTEGKLRGLNIKTTFIAALPYAKKYYQKYLPLMPIALDQLDLREYDLVISSESGPAKGVITNPDALHVCYCHSPMRYIWDMYPDYLNSVGMLTRIVMRPMVHYLRMYDHLSADRVDYFIANSNFVAKRIEKFYRRDSHVINPPVDVSEFTVQRDKEDYYLVLGQLTNYKRTDLVVDAFLASGRRLVVIGDGEQLTSLKKKGNENVQILGKQSWSVCKKYLSNAKALIFAGVEDFGMVPVEAMACGTPVLAFARGGALETVIDGVTGHFFHEQNTESLNNCISKFEAEYGRLNVVDIVAQANRFSKEKFELEIKRFMARKINGE
jgi:glycosyltransferase involved in cell wall biosynthesis